MQQPVTPIVQIDPPQAGAEVGVADVLLGSVALIGVLIVAALVVGLLTGGIFILLRRWREARSPDADDSPHTRLDLSSPVRPAPPSLAGSNLPASNLPGSSLPAPPSTDRS